MKNILLLIALFNSSFVLAEESYISMFVGDVDNEINDINTSSLPVGMLASYSVGKEALIGGEINYFNGNEGAAIKSGVRMADFVFDIGAGVKQNYAINEFGNDVFGLPVRNYDTSYSSTRFITVTYKRLLVRYTKTVADYSFIAEKATSINPITGKASGFDTVNRNVRSKDSFIWIGVRIPF